MSDPVEKIIEDALNVAEIAYARGDARLTLGLDFRVGEVYIECKRFYTPRLQEQLQRVDNVILIQGMKAAEFFAKLLTGERRG